MLHLNQVTEDTYSMTPKISKTSQYFRNVCVCAHKFLVPSEKEITIKFRMVGLSGGRKPTKQESSTQVEAAVQRMSKILNWVVVSQVLILLSCFIIYICYMFLIKIKFT